MKNKNLLTEYMWGFVYVFPLIFSLIVSFHNPIADLGEFFNISGFNILTNGVIYSSLSDLFGASGILPLFTVGNNVALMFSTWFISVFLIHLCVDFLLFIPRLAHKYMNMLGGKND